MTIHKGFNSRLGKSVMLVTAGVLGGIAMAVTAETPQIRDSIVGVQEIEYGKPVQDGTTTISAAHLPVDPVTGALVFMAKFTKGTNVAHTHPDGYHGVVLKGVMSHWSAGLPEAGEKRLDPGSYWYQPGTVLHREGCLSDECVLFVVHDGITKELRR
jgi:hypothetical protein